MQIEIYRGHENDLEIRVNLEKGTIWLTQKQIAQVFEIQRPAITKHLNNIFKSIELDENSVSSILEHTAEDGKKYKTKFFNLDAIISVGYRVNSIRATEFRIWATKRLNEYLVKGYALNQKRLEENKIQFLQTLEDLKILSQNNNLIEAKDILSLIKSFSNTWFSLDSYDKNEFPSKGTKEEIELKAKHLQEDLHLLKKELIQKGEASELFAQEKRKGNLEGIFGNIFQSVFGEDAYPTLEEKAAHLLYFVIKNHPFTDGNKRSGAFAFIWFMQKAKLSFQTKINPETLTTLTILIADSKPEDKNKMIGIVLLLLNQKTLA